MKTISTILFCLIFGVILVSGSRQESDFDDTYFSQHRGEKVYRIEFKGVDKLTEVLAWAGVFDLDVWSVYRGDAVTNGYVDVRLPQQDSSKILNSLPSGVSNAVFVDDVELRMREQIFSSDATQVHPSRVTDPSFFLSYHSYDEINTFMSNLADAHPQIVRMFQFGNTSEGNAIMAVEITSPFSKGQKKEILIHSLIHAREWISGATLTYLIDYLVETFSTGSGDSAVEQFQWTVVPVLNVDGYLYTWSKGRMWRKNRRKVSQNCWGVDNNRNFPYKWGITAGGESSADPCAETYHGPSANSELETQAVVDWWHEHRHSTSAYFDIHAYGELWLQPWGYTFERPPLNDYYLQSNSSTVAVEAIYKVHKQTYVNGEAATTIYPTSGDSTDASYAMYDIVYSQALELRGPRGSAYGFLLPANQIIPQGQEFVAGINAMLEYVLEHPAPQQSSN